MTSQPAPRFRRPDRGPSPAELAERDTFAQRTAQSLDMVRGSARTWRNGLIAFITLVTTGVIIKGRGTATGLQTPWLLAITILIGGGLALTIIGLWQVLAAEAGYDPRLRNLPQIRATHGSLTAYDLHTAAQSGQRLHRARAIVAVAVLLLLVGVITTWWAPPTPATPRTYLKVTHGDQTTCGGLSSADGGQLRLTVPGQHAPAVIPFTQVTNLATTTTCP